MASSRPGRVGKVKGISSPFVVLSLVMCRDGVDRWVLVDHGGAEEMDASADNRRRFVEGLDAAYERAAQRWVQAQAVNPGTSGPRPVGRAADSLPPTFTAMPTAEAAELLASNAPMAPEAVAAITGRTDVAARR